MALTSSVNTTTVKAKARIIKMGFEEDILPVWKDCYQMVCPR